MTNIIIKGGVIGDIVRDGKIRCRDIYGKKGRHALIIYCNDLDYD
jgi:hypothetical protein